MLRSKSAQMASNFYLPPTRLFLKKKMGHRLSVSLVDSHLGPVISSLCIAATTKGKKAAKSLKLGGHRVSLISSSV
jgi:hypothetical protein